MNKSEQTLYVCLGRTGDILNLLPLLHNESASAKPALLVSKEFIDVLDGVTYVDPVPWYGNWMDIKGAVAKHSEGYKELKVCQVAGFRQDTITEAYERAGLSIGDPIAESFAKEQWRLAGKLMDWRLKLPLVFDNRDADREAEAIEAIQPPLSLKKRIVLVNLGGVSSPYPYRDLLWDFLAAKLRPKFYQIIDISEMRLTRIYDLIGLYKKAFALVSIDTATLHLARAVPSLPVCALIQDEPRLWHGSPWSPQHISHVRYHSPERLQDIPNSIANMKVPGNRFHAGKQANVFHVWTSYDITPTNKPRMAAARETWDKVYDKFGWQEVCIPVGAFGRDSTTVYNPKESRFPFLRDVLRAAMLACNDDNDLIVLTRPDTCLGMRWAAEATECRPFCFGLSIRKEDEEEEGKVVAGTDLFCFTRGWIRENQTRLPDMILGNDPYWHQVLMELMRKEGAYESRRACYRGKGPPVPVVESSWRGVNGQFMSLWMSENDIGDKYPPLAKQIECVQINKQSIFKNGYNPTLIPMNVAGVPGHLMLYRAHRWNDARTAIGIAQLDEDLNVKVNSWMKSPDIGQLSEEDPRFFWHKSMPHLSFVVSNFPHIPMMSDVHYGQLLKEGKEWRISGVHKMEPRQMIEKNWIFFEHDSKLYCIYSVHPEQVVFEVEKGKIVNEWKTNGFNWGWGDPRGGTQPEMINGKMIRLFHSRTTYDVPPTPWRYHIGAVEMKPEPPFEVTNVSIKPIVSATRDCDPGMNCRHLKYNVLFPSNWFASGNRMHVAAGVNDCACFCLKLDPQKLNLP